MGIMLVKQRGRGKGGGWRRGLSCLRQSGQQGGLHNQEEAVKRLLQGIGPAKRAWASCRFAGAEGPASFLLASAALPAWLAPCCADVSSYSIHTKLLSQAEFAGRDAKWDATLSKAV